MPGAFVVRRLHTIGQRICQLRRPAARRCAASTGGNVNRFSSRNLCGSQHLFIIVDPENVMLIVIVSFASLGLVIRSAACKFIGGSAFVAYIADSEKACDVVAA